MVLNVLLGLVVAVIVYVVCTAVFVFAHSNLVFALVALVIFVAIAFGGVGTGFTRRRW